MEIHFQRPLTRSRTYFDDPAQTRPNRKIVLHLAVKLAAVTADTSFRIVKKVDSVQGFSRL
jgi:hypothetical protein